MVMRRFPVFRLRSATIWSVLLGYTLVASGLPLPLGGTVPMDSASPIGKRLAAKDRSRPFPCMDKPCGCATAEQCFTNCCCNTPAETLAWARARGIDAGVIAGLERRVAADPGRPRGGCCSAKADAGCCASRVAAVDGSRKCGEPPSPAAPPAGVERVEDSRSIAPRTVSIRAMLACGGLVEGWLSCGVAVPPPLAVAAVTTCAARTGLVAIVDESFVSERSAPDRPPPRA